MVSFCEYCNEPPSSIKGGVSSPYEYQMFMEEYAPWSQDLKPGLLALN
jgi:hypothetical protein